MLNTLSQYRKKRFSRKAISYDEASTFQKEMAKKVVHLLTQKDFSSSCIENALELGCGTGHLTQYLFEILSHVNWSITDSSIEMIERCKQKYCFFTSANWQVFDANNLPNKQYDLITSNALVQWLNLESHSRDLNKALNKDGWVLISGFLHDNFKELKVVLEEIFSEEKIQKIGMTKEYLEVTMESAGFEKKAYLEETKKVFYSSALDFFSTIHSFGGSGLVQEKITKGTWNKILDLYQLNNSELDNIYATWKPWYGLWQKKS